MILLNYRLKQIITANCYLHSVDTFFTSAILMSRIPCNTNNSVRTYCNIEPRYRYKVEHENPHKNPQLLQARNKETCFKNLK